ncbi:MAG: Maf family protein [Clostridia bacterium]|nr:Maf family protein [Clostridia bacterium]
MHQIILASKSPRRVEILKELGMDVIVVPSDIDETLNCIDSPEQIVMDLALRKAKRVIDTGDMPGIVIGADTIVVADGKILGKPDSIEDAYNMIKMLQGRYHNVITGVALIDSDTGRTIVDYQKTKVKIKTLSDSQIIKYLNKEKVFDKAGSYAIQGYGSVIVEKIDGCYFNVVGLPVSKLYDMLKKFGIDMLS